MKVSKSLASRLSLYIVLASSVIYFAALAGIGSMVVKAVDKSIKVQIQNSLSLMTSEVESVLKGVEKATTSMIWVVKEHLDDPDYMYGLTARHVGQHDEIIGGTVAFRENFYPSKGKYFAPYSCNDAATGEIRTIQMGGEDYDYFSMPWYRDAVGKNCNVWSEPYYDEGGGDRMMTTFSVPIWDEGHRPIAVLTADASLDDIKGYLEGIEMPFRNAYLFITSASGSIITAPGDSAALSFVGAMTAGESGTQVFVGDNGTKSTITYAPLSNGWSIAVVCSYMDIFSEASHANLLLAVITLLGFLMMYISVKLIIRRIMTPITKFTYAAMDIAKGDFNTQIPEVKTDDEMGKLHDALTFMLQSINDYIVELKRSTAANERFESELNIAAGIQRQMLPSVFPSNPDVDLYAALHPAKEVGGDLYDFFIKGDYLYFAVGDVSGKGVPAAMYMAITRSAFRFVAGMNLNLGEVMDRINNSFCQGNDSNMFVTLFAAKLNLKTGIMQFCNAGHNPIVVISPDGKARFLSEKPNLAAGLFENFPYEAEETTLAKGTRLLVYTDGVSEAETSDKMLFGDDRLLQFASTEDSSKTSEEFITDLLTTVKVFTAGADQNDDITAMSIRI